MANKIIFLWILAMLIISCDRKNKFPEKVMERVSPDKIKLLDVADKEAFDQHNVIWNTHPDKQQNGRNTGNQANLESGSNKTESHNPELIQDTAQQKYDAGNTDFLLMEKYVRALAQFKNRDRDFNLDYWEMEWEKSLREIVGHSPGVQEIRVWFDITALLMELTADARYAEELERLSDQGELAEKGMDGKGINDLILPFIYTKSADHIHVNIFTPSEIGYEHTLQGGVKITQEHVGPGRIEIRFSMEKRRYIELNVRIPSWTKGATVTEKKVKYLAIPGEYCRIAKKWNEGDVVEVVFPGNGGAGIAEAMGN